jgi:hypothetical protein
MTYGTFNADHAPIFYSTISKQTDEDIIGSNMTMSTSSIPKNYLHGSRKGLIAYGKHGRLM